MNKIILFELNEVPIRIFEYYIKVRPNSWIAKNFSKLKKHQTFTENKGNLSPWSTWPTLHRGVASDRHYISDFNQDLNEVDKEFPPIWKILSDNNITTGVFGSLHSFPIPENLDNYSFFVPDVFAPNHECFPKNVELFQNINLKLSRRSARNVDSSIPYGDVLNILFNIRNLGFTPGTILSVGKHLTQERIDSWKVIRRRTYQTVLSFDVFYKLLETKRPDFVTFFTNHVASSMHRYWAALFPDDYEDNKYKSDWIDTYSNEILFTMDETDKMLRRLAKFVDNNNEYKLLITSSMGQEAVECEPTETQLLITNKDKFMKMLGVDDPNGYKEMPAMVPQFNFVVTDSYITKFEERLKNIAINGQNIDFRKKENDFFSIDIGYWNLKETNLTINGKPYPFEESGFENVEIQDKSASSAYHIPEGHLFLYHPGNKISDHIEKDLLTCDILPMVLNNFNIERKDYMNKTAYNMV